MNLFQGTEKPIIRPNLEANVVDSMVNLVDRTCFCAIGLVDPKVNLTLATKIIEKAHKYTIVYFLGENEFFANESFKNNVIIAKKSSEVSSKFETF